MDKKLYFTTSWDDGSNHDIRLVELLNKYHVKGTFYIPKEFNHFDDKFSEYGRRLSEEKIILISKTQEIGAHSLKHSDFSTLSDHQLKEEIFGSKIFLEKIIEKEVKIFSSPKGFVNKQIISIAKQAGYKGLRTTDKLNFLFPKDPFRIGISIQCAPFPLRKSDSSHYNWKKLVDPIKAYGFDLIYFLPIIPKLYSWQSFSKSFFRYSVKKGNYFHLFGHSWELEKYQMWNDLESFFNFVKQFKNIEYVFNSEIVDLK